MRRKCYVFFCAISITDKTSNYQGNDFLVPQNSSMLVMPQNLNCEFLSMSAMMLHEHILYERNCSFNRFSRGLTKGGISPYSYL